MLTKILLTRIQMKNNYDNLSEDWAENKNVSLENSNKEELEAFEDYDITNADDAIIYESQKRNSNEI